MARWAGTQKLNGVVVLPRVFDRVDDELFAYVTRQLAARLVVVIPMPALAENNWPIWLRVWQPGRWVYFAAFAAATSEHAVVYARSQPFEVAKRKPDSLSPDSLFTAAQVALRHFRSTERETKARDDYRPGYASPAQRNIVGPASIPPAPTPAPPAPRPVPQRQVQDQAAVRRAAIAEYDEADAPELPAFQDANPFDLMLLLALMRNNPSERLEIILPLRDHPTPLTPYVEADPDLIRTLWGRGWLHIDETSPLDAFEWDGDTPTAHYPDSVIWKIALPKDMASARALLVALERQILQKPWPKAYGMAVLGLWYWVAHLECVAYLELSLEDHHLPFQAGEKTHSVIEKLLEHFSIGQIHNLIWRAARDAGARIQREAITPRHAANGAIGNIERLGDRAQSEGWTLKPYRRDRRLQESTLSHLVFRVMLGFDEPFEVRIDTEIVRAHIQPTQSQEG